MGAFPFDSQSIEVDITNAQTQLRSAGDTAYDYKYIVNPYGCDSKLDEKD